MSRRMIWPCSAADSTVSVPQPSIRSTRLWSALTVLTLVIGMSSMDLFGAPVLIVNRCEVSTYEVFFHRRYGTNDHTVSGPTAITNTAMFA